MKLALSFILTLSLALATTDPGAGYYDVVCDSDVPGVTRYVSYVTYEPDLATEQQICDY